VGRSKLAGHVTVQDFAIVNGMTGVIQFVHLGAHSFIGATNKVTRDIPPFMIAEGNPSVVRGVNVVGLERRGFQRDRISTIRRALKELEQISEIDPTTIQAITDDGLNKYGDWKTIRDFVAESRNGIARIARKRSVE
jgi:UDP-N-acetylglucosamine acyltransferase